MKPIYMLILLVSLSAFANAQLCTADGRFSQDPFFSDAQISSQLNITYGNATNWTGSNVVLRLDVYYPTLAIDTLPLRPLILMVHGGGLVSGNKSSYTRVCKEFAKRGFVAATINYRLGLNCNTDSISEEKAKYRAQQDVNAALRYVTENASLLRVDTSWMFIGGGSAGSVASLGIVYISQAEWNAFTPSLQPLLGNLNNSGNSLTNTFSIKGIFNDWGGMLKAAMQPDEMLPMVSFHGEADSTVLVDSSFGGGCTHVDRTYGSRAMHSLLLANGVCSDLSVKPGGGHGVYQDSVFGTPFRVGRAACFFKSLFCNICSSFYQTDSVKADCSQTTGISNIEFDEHIKVYPNPAQNYFTVEIPNQNFFFEVFDPLGRKMFSQINISGKTEIDCTGFPEGIYFIKAEKGEKFYTQRIIKQ